MSATVYADSNYYLNSYCGTLSQKDYTRLAPRASAYLDAIARRPLKLDAMSDLLAAAVKNACCALAEVFYRLENGGGVTRESNDGLSVTYRDALRSAPPPEEELAAAARLYLAHTGLLYAGI